MCITLKANMAIFTKLESIKHYCCCSHCSFLGKLGLLRKTDSTYKGVYVLCVCIYYGLVITLRVTSVHKIVL